jgi:hypothetical protein
VARLESGRCAGLMRVGAVHVFQRTAGATVALSSSGAQTLLCIWSR